MKLGKLIISAHSIWAPFHKDSQVLRIRYAYILTQAQRIRRAKNFRKNLCETGRWLFMKLCAMKQILMILNQKPKAVS